MTDAPSSPTVRLATAQDAVALLSCDPHAQEHPARQRALSAWVSRGVCQIAEWRGEPVGFFVLEHNFFGHGFVALLCVRPVCRRVGIGAQLVREAMQQCRTEKLFTSTNASNYAAQRLFEQAGFVASGSIDNLDAQDAELVYFKALPGRSDAPMWEATLR